MTVCPRCGGIGGAHGLTCPALQLPPRPFGVKCHRNQLAVNNTMRHTCGCHWDMPVTWPFATDMETAS